MSLIEPLFLNGLATMYDTEQRLAMRLAKLAKGTVSAPLRFIFESQLADTAGHVGTLELVFATFNREPRSRKCRATLSLLKAVEVGGPKPEDGDDATAISAAQEVTRHKLTSYGCLRSQAEALGNMGAAELLAEILQRTRDNHDVLSDMGRDPRHGRNSESTHSERRSSGAGEACTDLRGGGRSSRPSRPHAVGIP